MVAATRLQLVIVVVVERRGQFCIKLPSDLLSARSEKLESCNFVRLYIFLCIFIQLSWLYVELTKLN